MKRTAKRIRLIVILGVLLLGIVLLMDNAARMLYPVKYKEFVAEYSLENNLDPCLVLAVIKTESNFRPKVVSRRNAKGLMQISDKTGKWGAERLKLEDYTTDRLFDPETNIAIGCWYLGVLMKQYEGNLDLVLAAYNGGSGNVSQWLKDKSLSHSGKTLDRIPFKETERYVKKVRNSYTQYKRLYGDEF